MSKISDEVIIEIAEQLIGQCTCTIESLLEDRHEHWDDVTLEQFQLIDSIVLECENCGWYCCAEEVDNGICADCAEN